ncbi:MAG TPA: response regulator [Rhizomicrobium sp.]
MSVQHASLHREPIPPAADSRALPGVEPEIRFGRYRVVPGARHLFAGGRRIELGSRAFDLLVVLLRGRGTVVTKDEIVSHVWPSTVVDESNLRFQMAALRRALGLDRDLIKTIPGRGYLLAVESAPHGAETAAQAADPLGGDAPAEDGEEPVVVIIDDDRRVREALVGLLQSAGIRVEMFASIREYAAGIRAWRPVCMILDVWMPGESGLDFQARLVEDGVRIPVIFISGHADVPMSVRAMKAGAVEFLTKPVHHQDLLGAVFRAIGSGPRR